VLGINPAGTSTERIERLMRVQAKQKLGNAERWQELLTDLPFGRLLAPEEIANLALFLVFRSGLLSERDRRQLRWRRPVPIGRAITIIRRTSMKRFLIALLAVLSLLPAGAQAASDGSKASRAVAATIAQLHQAMIDRDGGALNRLTDEALTYGHSTGVTEDRTTFVANLVAGKSPYGHIEFQDAVITVRGNVAWARGLLLAQMKNAAGGPIRSPSRSSTSSAKKGGGQRHKGGNSWRARR